MIRATVLLLVLSFGAGTAATLVCEITCPHANRGTATAPGHCAQHPATTDRTLAAPPDQCDHEALSPAVVSSKISLVAVMALLTTEVGSGAEHGLVYGDASLQGPSGPPIGSRTRPILRI